jgi:hypothetical protein
VVRPSTQNLRWFMATSGLLHRFYEECILPHPELMMRDDPSGGLIRKHNPFRPLPEARALLVQWSACEDLSGTYAMQHAKVRGWEDGAGRRGGGCLRSCLSACLSFGLPPLSSFSPLNRAIPPLMAADPAPASGFVVVPIR